MDRRILIVEDDATLLKTLSKVLLGLGYTIETAVNGYQALAKCSEAKFDLILLDIQIPGSNGLEVCAQLRSEGLQIPILFLTGKNSEFDIARGLNAGADGYITKPFSLIELKARINTALNRHNFTRKPERTINFDNIRIDLDEKIVWLENNPVVLRPREWEILVELIKVPGKVVAKDHLVEAYQSTKGSIEVYIRRLRKLLGEGFILTVARSGYYISQRN